MNECADTRVGNVFIKGISGGQKKRLSLAMAMLKSPSIIFMDEVERKHIPPLLRLVLPTHRGIAGLSQPTSGLDAAGAASVMAFLGQMARESNTLIIATIHQPSTSVFMSFDKTMVLANGRLCYCGPAAELSSFCDSIGQPVPGNANPADFFLELVNSEFSGGALVDKVVAAWRATETNDDDEARAPAKTPLPEVMPAPGFFPQLIVLLGHLLRLSVRDPSIYLGR